MQENTSCLSEVSTHVGRHGDASTQLGDILSRIIALLKRYLILPEYGYETIALYIVQTYLVYDIGTFAPLLVLRSPEMQSGKTSTMDLLGDLVNNPLAAANVSPAALYRRMSDSNPTVLLDEVDTFLKQKSESAEAIRGIINAGHRKGRYSVVLRVTEKGAVQEFNVFSPKILAGIGSVAPTIQDRAIVLTLRRKLPSERTQRLRIARIASELEEFRLEIAEVANEVRDQVAAVDPRVPQDLSDRAADNWELLFGIAETAGGYWPETARRASLTLGAQNTMEDSVQVQLLRDIAEFASEDPRNIWPSADLVEYLLTCDHAPWPHYAKGQPLTPQNLAAILRSFGIIPTKIACEGTKVRGYRREWVDDAFKRSLPLPNDPTSSLDVKNAGTPVPAKPISLTATDLFSTGLGTGYHTHLEPSVSTDPIRYSEPDRNHANPLMEKHLRDSGTRVPGISAGSRDGNQQRVAAREERPNCTD